MSLGYHLKRILAEFCLKASQKSTHCIFARAQTRRNHEKSISHPLCLADQHRGDDVARADLVAFSVRRNNLTFRFCEILITPKLVIPATTVNEALPPDRSLDL
jgi:hypothetical protein